MNKELMEALDSLEKEKNISRETLFDAIETSLITAYRNHYNGKSENVTVVIDRDTCEYKIIATKEIVESADDIEDKSCQISLADAKAIDHDAQVGGTVEIEIQSREFGRIATQNAKNVILQKIREEERNAIFSQFNEKEKDVVTGIVQRFMGKNISIDLGKADAVLSENEQVKSEHLRPTERIKVYILSLIHI